MDNFVQRSYTTPKPTMITVFIYLYFSLSFFLTFWYFTFFFKTFPFYNFQLLLITLFKLWLNFYTSS